MTLSIEVQSKHASLNFLFYSVLYVLWEGKKSLSICHKGASSSVESSGRIPILFLNHDISFKKFRSRSYQDILDSVHLYEFLAVVRIKICKGTRSTKSLLCTTLRSTNMCKKKFLFFKKNDKHVQFSIHIEH